MPATETAPPSGPANRRWKRWTPLLLVLVGFAAGVLVTQQGQSLRRHRGESAERRQGRGDASDRRAGRRRGEGSEMARFRGRDTRENEDRGRRFRDQLVRRLDLDEGQQERMDAFIEANRAEARAFWDDTYARYRELRLRFREQIREILTDAQRDTFEALISERERNDGDSRSVEGSGEGPPHEGGMR